MAPGAELSTDSCHLPRDKEDGGREKKGSGAILSSFNCLFVLVNLEILFFKEVIFGVLDTFGSLQAAIKIDIPFQFVLF